MDSRDSLGDRMKAMESIPRHSLVPKIPVLMRLDGKAFHTLTHGMEKPWCKAFNDAMWYTAVKLCEQIQGAQVAYVASDEIQILLIDYQSIKTQGYFNYEIQKMCSVAAGIASVHFTEKLGRVGIFDCRVWNVPREEVTNCFIWRQNDCTRNSISALAQANFSHKELHGKDCVMMQDMLHEKGINWNDCATPNKRGVCIVKETYTMSLPVGVVNGPEGLTVVRSRWVVDENIPVFTQDREYINRFVYVGDAR